MVYFDNSATTKPRSQVVHEVTECMEKYYANPSSAHRLGMEAEKKLKTARERLARLINAKPGEIVFTSGGSEANNMAVLGVIDKGDHIITSRIEHPSVLKLFEKLEKEGFEVTYLDVDGSGAINLEKLGDAIKDNTRLVSIMYVNNEIGTIQPVFRIVQLVREKNRKTKVHVDAVQALGKLPVDVKKLDVDLMSFSAHKIHGPKGVGALYIKNNFNLKPLLIGGGQESDLRSGTENLPGISGFGVAAELAGENMEAKLAHVKALKRYFIQRLQEVDGILINSPSDEAHIDAILNVSFEGVKGEVLLRALEDYEIYVSTGSACSAKKAVHRNYVLPAIGLKERHIESAIRFSFSHLNRMDEVDAVMDALKKILPVLRRIKK